MWSGAAVTEWIIGRARVESDGSMVDAGQNLNLRCLLYIAIFSLYPNPCGWQFGGNDAVA